MYYIYNNATIKTRDSGKISFLLGGITQKYDAPPLYYYYTFGRDVMQKDRSDTVY